MLQFQAKENKCIKLGRRGEDSAREILFDITGFAELYGQGEARLIVKRDRDLESYLATIIQDDTTVHWIVKPVDNDQPGYGNCELVYITDGVVAKSIIYQTHTDISLSDPVSPPNSPSTYASLESRLSHLEEEGISEYIEEYFKENPVKGGGFIASDTAPEDTSVLWVDTDEDEDDNLQAVINEALAQAKTSGEFDGKDGKDGTDGKDGYTPKKGVDYFDGQDGKDGVDGKDGYTPQKGIDYFDGKDGKDGQDGKDYVLTDADKQEIAEMASEMVEVPEGGTATMQPLTFTGAVNATYDGSEAVSVEIPVGGGESEWVELVNVTLEEAASFDQTVDYSYNEYILAFVVPKDTTNLSSGRGTFLGVQNVLYYQSLASNANYAYKFIAHGRKMTDTTMIASLVRVQQNGSQIVKSLHQGSSYLSAPTLVEHLNGRMYIEGILPAGTVIAIYAR